jgi:hypothetical protein
MLCVWVWDDAGRESNRAKRVCAREREKEREIGREYGTSQRRRSAHAARREAQRGKELPKQGVLVRDSAAAVGPRHAGERARSAAAGHTDTHTASRRRGHIGALSAAWCCSCARCMACRRRRVCLQAPSHQTCLQPSLPVHLAAAWRGQASWEPHLGSIMAAIRRTLVIPIIHICTAAR